MLNLPNPQGLLPIDLAVLALPEPETLPAVGPVLPEFSHLLAAAGGGDPAAGGTAESAGPAPDSEQPEAQTPAIAQAWAHVLVPELANLPAPLPPPPPGPAPQAEDAGAVAGDAASLAVANDLPWPRRAAASWRLAVQLPAADPVRARGWQAALPSAPAPASLPAPIAAAPPPISPDPVLRTITGQPIPYPAPDLPTWYDPQAAPPWFDPANPPPAWSDPTRPPPTWLDPTKLPPAWMDPARIPAAWFDPSLPVARAFAAAQAAAAPAPLAIEGQAAPAPVSVPVAGPQAPALAPRRQTMLPPVMEALPARRKPVATERADAPPALASPLPLLPPPAIASTPAPVTADRPPPAPMPLPTAAPDPALSPNLSIASDRLGDVAVRLSGSADQLQVVMQAQPAAAALIGADAPRLSQDLAAAGVALAGLSVNGQRADLSGGQRDRQRQPNRREDAAPLASVRRLSGRTAARPTLTIDRFA